MAEATPLDRAHAAMQAAPEGDTARLRFYGQFAAAELFLLLEDEAAGAQVNPRTFAVDGARYVLVFDREERLADFAQDAAPYVALSGRAVAGMLAPEGLGLALNPDVAPSAFLIPPDAVAWLAGVVAQAPEQSEDRITAFHAPAGLPEALLTELDAGLARAEGRAEMAYLVGVTYAGGGHGHLLGFVNAREGAEAALARTVAEVLQFSGIEAAELDVAFFRAGDPAAARLAKAGLRFDLPQPVAEQRTAPGMDPDKPPRLK